MKAARLFQQTYTLATAPSLQQTRITASHTARLYSNIAPLRPSPFHSLFARNLRRSSIRHTISKRFTSSKPPFNPTPNLNSPEPSLSITQRFRKLSREYGYSALAVYLLLSALDFPFCFLAVRWLGTERIGRWEHAILEWFWRVVPFQLQNTEDAPKPELEIVGKNLEQYSVVESTNGEVGVPGYDHGVAEAEKRNRSEDASEEAFGHNGKGDADTPIGLWTQLALAYAIHKSFIFVRVPITAAITPKVVKMLRKWGWDIGKRKPKAPKEIKKD